MPKGTLTEVESSVQLTSNIVMEQHTLKTANNSLNTNIYTYLETSGGQSFNVYLKIVNTNVD
jgi:hypothetical protein